MTFSIRGLNHLGLIVEDMAIARDWFCNKLGFSVLEDRGDLLFLLVGADVLALKTPQRAVAKPEHGLEQAWHKRSVAGWQTLDHYGFFAQSPEEVDAFADFLKREGVTILKGPYTRRDGRSVYFKDPCGNVGEYLWWHS